MKSTRPEYLIDRLIKNELTKDELDELLSEIGQNEMSNDYSIILEKYFNQLLIESNITNKAIQQ